MKVTNVLISQPVPADLEKSPYGELAKKFRLNLNFRKFITVEGLTAKEFRKNRVNILDHTAIIFTSRNAVDHFFRICEELRVTIPETMKYFCISDATAFYLQKYVQFRKRKIFVGKQNFADLMEVIKKHKDENFLLPCSDIHKQEIPRLLNEAKITYKKAVIYKTLASDLSDIKIKDYHMLVFFSPAGIKSLLKNFPKFSQNSTLIAAFGPATSRAAKAAGLKLHIEAPSKKAPSMTMAIEQFLLQENHKK